MLVSGFYFFKLLFFPKNILHHCYIVIIIITIISCITYQHTNYHMQTTIRFIPQPQRHSVTNVMQLVSHKQIIVLHDLSNLFLFF